MKHFKDCPLDSVALTRASISPSAFVEFSITNTLSLRGGIQYSKTELTGEKPSGELPTLVNRPDSEVIDTIFSRTRFVGESTVTRIYSQMDLVQRFTDGLILIGGVRLGFFNSVHQVTSLNDLNGRGCYTHRDSLRQSGIIRVSDDDRTFYYVDEELVVPRISIILNVGLGYEFAVSKVLFIAPRLSYQHGLTGMAKSTSAFINSISVGLEVSYKL